MLFKKYVFKITISAKKNADILLLLIYFVNIVYCEIKIRKNFQWTIV